VKHENLIHTLNFSATCRLSYILGRTEKLVSRNASLTREKLGRGYKEARNVIST
jgi:hypothetical protein